MKFDSPRCPECDAPAETLSERVAVNAALVLDEGSGEYRYAGWSDVFWDTQKAVLDAEGRLEIHCEETHSWKVRQTN